MNVKFHVLILILFLLTIIGLIAQDTGNNTEPNTEEAVQAVPVVPDQKIEAVFPETNPALVFIEGEEAVSTNFAKEPTLNYAASASRTLQLNRSTGLQGGAYFYAEYVFVIPEAGTYEFWYGGTPPGPSDDLVPSYSSPFQYSIDDGDLVPAYREDVVVVDGYTPSYYWNSVSALELQPGIHKIKIVVNERRRYDNRFYFYLDNLFFVNLTRKDNLGSVIPDVFPDNLDNRILDSPFLSINEYNNLIQENPDRKNPYIELSLVYSLLGDYINALKNLKNATILDPEDSNTLLLTAKNRIWKGDFEEGLQAYRDLLELNPDQLDIWAEAGKVAAWVGKYADSLDFYTNGLNQFPDSLNLTVNEGLTHLWSGGSTNAAELFRKARDIALEDPALVKELASIYTSNGYPDRAVDIYLAGIQKYPQYLELYLLLQQTYSSNGQEDQAKEISSTIRNVFLESDRLNEYLNAFERRLGLKNSIINDYREQLAANPEDIQLREILVQTLFWNGLRKEAIAEYLNILTTYSFNHMKTFDRRSADLLEAMDNVYLYIDFFKQSAAIAAEYRLALTNALSDLNTAQKMRDTFAKKVDAARDKGEPTPEFPETGDPEILLLESGNTLADTLAQATEFTGHFLTTADDLEKLAAIHDELQQQEKEEQITFQQRISANGWKWNKEFMLDELKNVSENNGTVLADIVLAKISLYDEGVEDAAPFISAANNLATDTGVDIPALQYLTQQFGLWGLEKSENDRYYDGYMTAGEYVQYTDDFIELEESLRDTSSGAMGIYGDQTADEATEALGILSAIQKQTQTLSRTARTKLVSLNRILKKRLERAAYNLEEATYLLRFELGDYYFADGDMEQATVQFEQVLAIDPWNISATYKLGNVRQLYGDWHQAMEKYRQVFNNDPYYENAARYYNDLARAHPDTFSTAGYILSDTTGIVYHGQADFSTQVNSIVSFDLGYIYDATRRMHDVDYFSNGNPGSTIDQDAGTFMLHDLDVSVPVSLYPINLTITPTAGIMAYSNLDENTAAFADPNWRVVSANKNETMADFFQSLTFSPFFGGSIQYEVPGFNATGSYVYKQLKSTFEPDKERIMAHAAEATVFANLAATEIPFFQLTDLRTYGKISFYDDTNITGMILQDINVGIHVLDSPWSTLIFQGIFSFEHSQTPGFINYYAPDAVLVAKGGVLWSSWFALKQGNALGLIADIRGGLYTTSLITDPDNSFLLDGDVRFEYAKGNTSYFFSANALGTFSGGSFEYWSLLMQIGINARLPDLLAF